MMSDARVGQPARQTEIRHPDAALRIDQQIRRLDIPVDHTLFVRVGKCICRFQPNLGHPTEIRRTSRRIVRRWLGLAPLPLRVRPRQSRKLAKEPRPMARQSPSPPSPERRSPRSSRPIRLEQRPQPRAISPVRPPFASPPRSPEQSPFGHRPASDHPAGAARPARSPESGPRIGSPAVSSARRPHGHSTECLAIPSSKPPRAAPKLLAACGVDA